MYVHRTKLVKLFTLFVDGCFKLAVDRSVLSNEDSENSAHLCSTVPFGEHFEIEYSVPSLRSLCSTVIFSSVEKEIVAHAYAFCPVYHELLKGVAVFYVISADLNLVCEKLKKLRSLPPHIIDTLICY